MTRVNAYVLAHSMGDFYVITNGKFDGFINQSTIGNVLKANLRGFDAPVML
ncbi:MAG: hypothetical protein ACI96W_003885 [Paraglaciecola sp.]|jgi:hypothetical protein